PLLAVAPGLGIRHGAPDSRRSLPPREDRLVQAVRLASGGGPHLSRVDSNRPAFPASCPTPVAQLPAPIAQCLSTHLTGRGDGPASGNAGARIGPCDPERQRNPPA